MQYYDVIVTGAGPAGLFTAVHLADSLRVLVVESQRFPPVKPCGEILIDHGYRLVSELDPPPSVFRSPETITMRFVARDIDAPATEVGTAHTIDRKALSFWLDDLLTPNVEVVEGVRFVRAEARAGEVAVTLRHPGGRIETVGTGLLVGADGCLSRVRRSAFGTGLDTVDSIQHIYRARRPPAHADFIFDRELARDYYVWAFPRGDDEVLVGCPRDGDRYRTVMEWARGEYAITGAPLRSERHPIARIRTLDDIEIGSGRVLLVGEAAGLVSPASGEGLSLAFASGRAAARAISADPDNPVPAYREACRPFIDLLAKELELADRVRDRSRARALEPEG